MDEIQTINLDELKNGYAGVTAVLAQAHWEALLVCLHDQRHEPLTKLILNGDDKQQIMITWSNVVDDQVLRAWDSKEVATEWGAVGLALIMIEKLTQYTVVRRARTGTGFDYWLGQKDDPLFQKTAKLEVSGIRHALYESTVNARVRQKWKQVGDSKLISFVIVVEFSRPVVYMESK